MKVQVAQWDNSIAVRLPKSIAQDLRVGPGSEVEMWMEGSDLRIRPVPPVTSHRLEDLLAQITGDNVPEMEEWPPVGAEIINQSATIPATLSAKVQTDILRNDMGFKGLIVSDAMSMSGLTIYFTQEEAGVRAFLAGTDILEKPADVGAMLRGLKAAVTSGRISMSRLDDSVRRQLAWKHAIGLFDERITPKLRKQYQCLCGAASCRGTMLAVRKRK